MIYIGPSRIQRDCTLEPCDGSEPEPVTPGRPVEPADPTGGMVELIIR